MRVGWEDSSVGCLEAEDGWEGSSNEYSERKVYLGNKWGRYLQPKLVEVSLYLERYLREENKKSNRGE